MASILGSEYYYAIAINKLSVLDCVIHLTYPAQRRNSVLKLVRLLEQRSEIVEINLSKGEGVQKSISNNMPNAKSQQQRYILRTREERDLPSISGETPVNTLVQPGNPFKLETKAYCCEIYKKMNCQYI